MTPTATVYNTGTGYLTQIGEAKQQTIEQGATPVTRARMRDQTHWLVNHQPGVALSHNLEVHVIRFEGHVFWGLLFPDQHGITGVNRMLDLDGLAVDENMPTLDPGL